MHFLDFFADDFYVESGPDQKLGFPPGMTKKLVLSSLQKWENIAKCSSGTDPPINKDSNATSNEETENEAIIITEEIGPQVVEEIEVETSTEGQVTDKEIRLVENNRISDSYNGAVRDNYTWSQTISDLDVLIKIPDCIKTAKDLKVDLDSMDIKIEARTSTLAQHQEEYSDSEWTTIFMEKLCYKTRKNESVWSVVPGQHISIHFEKASERWWDALIVGEPKIELKKIDCSRNLDDMGLEEQMKVQELMWNHQQKLLGKPTSEDIRMEKIFRKAWNAKGSPFQGTPYDPSILNFSN
ncbi:nudC domain-containing protein 3 isoform X2 [Nomia melanderi]|uniref:nudC domain-containing protein 3 isoform X2 n=1 Tax=Nomia melanderi TaxID=2448451 RepID=UPI003FCD82B4